jgi:hypothetical protein
LERKKDYLSWENGHGHRFTHDWFRFPGKFHPPLVEHLIKIFSPTGVLDPMAGVGTVAVEAKAAGIPTMSMDIDPISTFFIEAKTTPISSRVLIAAWEDLKKAIGKYKRYEKELEDRMFHDIRIDVMRRELSRVQAEEIERLSYWFRRYVLVDYARIDHSIWNGGLPHRSDPVRRFFLACLLSSIRRISLADPSPVSGLEITKQMKKQIQEGYRIDVIGEFSRRVELAIRRMDEYSSYLREKGTTKTPVFICQEDCANLLNVRMPIDFGIDFILFSPPYCNAIEYWRRHRLEYLLGGFLDENEILELKKKFIGRTNLSSVVHNPPGIGYRPVDQLIQRLLNNHNSERARVLWQYFNDMRTRMEVFYKYLPNCGHCIIVVGDSATGGMKVPTADSLTWICQDIGFEYIDTAKYKIKNRAMQYPLKTNKKIDNEKIIVLRKP